MATLTKQAPGAAITYATCAGGGDAFPNSGHELVHVQNGGGSPCNVTVNSQRPCDQGFDHDTVFTVPAGDDLLFGPFSSRRFNDGSDLVQLTYDQVTSCTIAVIGT